MIKYPLRIEANARENSAFVYIQDAADRVIATSLNREDAEDLVRTANLGALPARTRSKRQKAEDLLRASVLGAQLTGRTDIDYGRHETLPRGEHVANLRKGAL